MKKNERYTDAFIASSLAILAANGGRVRETSREVSVPESTLRGWAARAEEARNSLVTTSRDDLIAELRAKKSGLLRDNLQSNAFLYLQIGDEVAAELYRKIPHMDVEELSKTLRSISTHLGIVVDKLGGLQLPAPAAKSGAVDPLMERLFSRTKPEAGGPVA